jgi:hypothetical protein
MIGATTKRTSAARRSWARRWTPALAGTGIVALAVTACSSGGTGSTAAPAVSSSPAPASSQQAFPGVTGTAAAVSGSSLEVQNPTSGQVTVTFTSSTAITDDVSATPTDVKVGSCVTVIGQSPASGGTASGATASRTVTATTVSISTPVNGDCTAAGGFGAARPQGNPSARPSFSARPRPSGSAGAFGGGFGGANGKVTSLSATGFVVQGRNPAAGGNAGGTTTTVAVTTTSTTKYTKVADAKSSALKAGECITAVGTTNSIGAVAAKTIRISQPGANGCVTGFGGGSGRPSSNG